MWKCHKCGKPVYFAERKQSLGFDWHPHCLRCEECGKKVNPGQHAEHKGVPYCHVPCYGALFGPQLYGHGTRVESHTSFGKPNSRSGTPHSMLEQKLKEYNGFYEGKSCEIRSREVNGRLVLEGALRIYWGVIGLIHLKEDDDQRTVVTIRKRNSCRYNSQDEESDIDGDVPERIRLDSTSYINDETLRKNEINNSMSNEQNETNNSTKLNRGSSIEDVNNSGTRLSPENGNCNGDSHCSKENGVKKQIQILNNHKISNTLPSKFDNKPEDWDELDDLLQVERKVDPNQKVYQTLSGPLQFASVSQQDSGISDSSSVSEKTIVDDVSSSSGDITPTSDITDTDGYSSVFETTLESNTLTRSISGPDAVYFDGVADDSASLTTKISRVLRSLSTPEDLKRGLDDDDGFTYVDKSIPPGTFPYDDSLKRYLNASYQSPQATEADPPIVLRRQRGNTAIKRRAGRRRERGALRRRCSINGHFYNRDTSFFTPPHGCQTSVWVTSLVSTSDVIAQLLDKYKVDSMVENFALFVVRDNGEQRRLREDEYPLEVRVILGPHEDVAQLFLMDARSTQEISSEVAQFLNLSIPECRNILERYQDEEEREARRIRMKYREMRKKIKERMEELKVRL